MYSLVFEAIMPCNTQSQNLFSLFTGMRVSRLCDRFEFPLRMTVPHVQSQWKKYTDTGAWGGGETGRPGQKPAKALPSGSVPAPRGHICLIQEGQSGLSDGGKSVTKPTRGCPSVFLLYFLSQLVLGSGGEMRCIMDWLAKPHFSA